MAESASVQARFRDAFSAAALCDAVTADCRGAMRRAEDPTVAAWIAERLGGEIPSRPEMGPLVGAARMVPLITAPGEPGLARFALPWEPSRIGGLLVPLWSPLLPVMLRSAPPSDALDATVLDALAVEPASGRWWLVAGLVDFLGDPWDLDPGKPYRLFGSPWAWLRGDGLTRPQRGCALSGRALDDFLWGWGERLTLICDDARHAEAIDRRRRDLLRPKRPPLPPVLVRAGQTTERKAA